MKRNHNTAAFAALGLVLACALTAALGACGITSAAHAAGTGITEISGTAATPVREVTVSASGTVKLTPDKASLTFGVTTQEKTADRAQKKNSEDVDRVISVLTSRNIEEKSIRTTDYSMYPQYDYSKNGEQKLTGYTVRTSLTIQDQDISEVGKLIADCVAAGINTVDNISFLCSGYDEAYKEALTKAVKTSHEKAEVLASAAGKKLGDPVTITEGYQNTSARYAKNANVTFDAAEEAAAMGPALMPGETDITANVTVTYEIK
ncbi:MAG: SIMPL domain-containing protein [Stomatobaculum sp.]|nr:SIMPL domain-containing protein [Stomatobaculum sp.]